MCSIPANTMLGFCIILQICFVYNVGNVAGMAEDGSFIGKYSKDRNPEQSSAFATLVWY